MTDLRKSLGHVMGALEGVKLRDAQELAETEGAIAAVDNAIADIDASLAPTAAMLDGTDLAAAGAFYAWRDDQMRRRQSLFDRRAALEIEADQQRQRLLQSNGEVEAAQRLIDAADDDARVRALKTAARRLEQSVR